jgi:WD40 repeat protein
MRSMEEALSLVFEHMARSDLVDVIPVAYRACKSLRNDLVGQGFCMKTFSLCRALASASVRTADESEMEESELSLSSGSSSHGEDDERRTETFERLQTTIARQIGWSPNQDERAWWLDARSLVQRCNSPGGPGNVWSWLQAASQEPDGPLSLQAAATAKILRQRLVRWPDKPRVRFPGLCTLTGHSGLVRSVAYSPDGKHIASASDDMTVKIWDSTTGKEVSVLVCHRPIVCCCVECSDLRVWSMSRSAR